MSWNRLSEFRHSPKWRALLQWLKTERGILAIILLVFAYIFWRITGAVPDLERAKERVAEAFAEGRYTNTKEYAYVGLWFAAWFNTLLCLLLAATLPLWHRPARTPETSGPSPPGSLPGPVSMPAKWFLPALILIVILAGALRAPLASGGFWHDEVLNAQRIVGYHRVVDDQIFEELDFREATWIDAAFFFRGPTNHTSMSVPARACHLIWQKATGAEPHAFSEFALRLPTYLAGLGAVFLAGLLLRRWGLPVAGIFAAFFLAIHPWHIRWGVDARSYSLTILFVLLALYALTHICQRGQWRWWAIFGFCQFQLMWGSLMNLWLAIAFFAFAAAIIWHQRKTIACGPQFSRLFLVNILAAGAFLQVMTPNLMQFKQYVEMRPPAEASYTQLDARSLHNTATNLLIGLPRNMPAAEGERPITTFHSLFEDKPTLGTSLMLAHGALLLLGAAFLWKHNRRWASMLLVGVFGACLLHLAFTQFRDFFFYPRFISYLLVAWCLLLGIAWEGIGRIAGKIHRRALTPSLATAMLTGTLFFLSTAGAQVHNLYNYPHEPWQEIRQWFTEQRTETPDGKILVAAYGLGGEIMMAVYDPTVRSIYRDYEILEFIEHANDNNIPLYVVYGKQSFNRAMVKAGFKLLDDRTLFQPVARFLAAEPSHTYFVLEYTGNPPPPDYQPEERR